MADENGTKSQGFSFGFSKKKASNILNKSVIKQEDTEHKEEKEFVTAVSENAIQSTNKPVEEVRELVIPLIKENRWRNAVLPEDLDADDDTSVKEKKSAEIKSTGDEVTDQAVRELLHDAEHGAREEEEKKNFAIPLLMKNAVPAGFETDDCLDVSLRPDEANDADYEQVPVDQYGMAMLRGMGWKNSNSSKVKPVDAVLRPKGLGLGADKSTLLQAKHEASTKNDSSDAEQLQMTKGAYCVVENGKHKGLYGEVEGVDEDNARVFIKLTLHGDHITISQYAIKLITKAEHKQCSKYINKEKYDEYTSCQAESDQSKHRHKEKHSNKRRGDKHSDRSRHSDRDSDRHTDRHSDRDSDRHTDRHSDRDSDRHTDRDRDSDRHTDRHSDRDSDRHRDKSRERDRRDTKEEYDSRLGPDRSDDASGSLGGRHKRDKDRGDYNGHHSNKDSHSATQEKRRKHGDPPIRHSSTSRRKESWLNPFLRVRVIDKNYKGGKYYKEKVVIEDVTSIDSCMCRTDAGKVLEGLSQSQLETVIPRSESSFIMVVNGKHKSQIGEVLKKEKDACVAMVQLLTDRDAVLQLPYEEICEYTGDATDQFDY